MAKYKKLKAHSPAETQIRKSGSAKSELQLSTDQPISAYFCAHDTWFFRESRPHDAVGASELTSLFPPPVRTLVGALRSFIGEKLDINWNTWQSLALPDFDVQAAIGGADDLGNLQFQGSWIIHDGQRLYPAPLYLMHTQIKSQDYFRRLHPGQPIYCDLGKVRLPQLPKDCKDYKTLEQRWITGNGLALCLNNQVPNASDIKSADQLFGYEARLGIARNNLQHSIETGKLYQTRHLRLHDDVQVELQLSGLAPELLTYLQKTSSHLIRLGGEGRMASLSLKPSVQTLPYAKAKTVDRLILHFLTPADFAGHWHPADFIRKDNPNQTIWQGTINGIALSIEAAVIGKVHREGGWDMQKHQPRPVKSYIPAGSAWFCRLSQPTDWDMLSQKLHGQCIGQETIYGRGLIAIGHWQDTFNA